MKPIFVNGVGARLPAVVEGLAQQKAAQLKAIFSIRPFRKVLTYTTDVTQDLFIVIIQLFPNPALDRIIVVNGNEFRVVSATENTVAWKGGIPPFTVTVSGQFQDQVGTLINLDEDIYTIIKGIPREFTVMKRDDADGWWAADNTLDINGAAVQLHVGVEIIDSSSPPRSIFAPFAPKPTYEADGETPAGLFAKYPTGHFGPGTWCVPTLHFPEPAAITYGEALTVGVVLNAAVHIPGTTTPLPGTMAYWLDAEHTVPAENTVPNANTGLPLYATFLATDDLHYHPVEAESGIVVNKTDQVFQFVRGIISDYDSFNRVGDRGYLQVTTHNTASGNSVQFFVSPAVVSLSNGGVATNITGTDHYGQPFNCLGVFWEITGIADPATVSGHQAGSSNYNQSDTQYLYFHDIRATILSPVITFGSIPALTVGGTFTITASSTSPSQITFILQNDVNHNGDITSGGQLTCNHAGTANLTIRALQDGNEVYTPGVQDVTVSIGKGTPVIVWPAVGEITYGTDLTGKLNATAYAPDGVTELPGSYVYSERDVTDGHLIQIVTESTILDCQEVWRGLFRTLQVDFTPTNTDDYNNSVVNGDSQNDIIINKADQTITSYGLNLSSIRAGASTTAYATGGSSGNAIVFSSSNTSVATVSGNNITGMAIGTCTIYANQDGNNNYNAAPQVTVGTLTVIAAALTITGYENNLTRKVYFSGGTEPYSCVAYGNTFNVGFYPMTTSYFQISPLNPNYLWCGTGGVRLSSGDGQHVDVPYSSYPSGAQPPVACTWQTLAEYTCPSLALLQYNVGSTWYNGTVRRVSPDGKMAVTWGWINNSDSTDHGPPEVVSLLGITYDQANTWFWPNLNTEYLYIHVTKIEQIFG